MSEQLLNIENLPLIERAEMAMEHAYTQVRPLVDQIELVSPNHMFGQDKVGHMKNLAAQTDIVAGRIDITKDDDKVLLRTVLGMHDFGRFVEAAKQIGIRSFIGANKENIELPIIQGDDGKFTLRDDKRHGFLSVTLLELLGVLKNSFFNKEEEYVIRQAITQHAERTMEINRPEFNTEPAKAEELYKLAGSICESLRLFDKVSILEEPKFLTTPGILGELAHYGIKAPADIDDREKWQSDMLQRIEELRIKPIKGNNDDQIDHILSTGLDPDALERFTQHVPLKISDVAYSYANYMLMQLAMVYDIKNKGFLEEIQQGFDKYLKARLIFIANRVPPEQFVSLYNSLADYFTSVTDIPFKPVDEFLDTMDSQRIKKRRGFLAFLTRYRS